MTKKGVADVIVTAILAVGFGSTILAGILLQPKHIIRKANDRCIAYGGSAYECQAMVSQMSKEERIEYIRDTVERPQPKGANLGG